MSLLDRLLRKKSELEQGGSEDDDIPTPADIPVEGPPEFQAIVQIQKAYWTHNPDEQAQLEARDVNTLEWNALLRLHHLLCLQRLKIQDKAERVAFLLKALPVAHRLVSETSPYRPLTALVWQGEDPAAIGNRPPDHQGTFLNPSLTHIGCLEVYRVDENNTPTAIDFVSFDEIAGIIFAPSKIIRAAKLFYEDGREGIVFAPLLYGTTWTVGEMSERDGSMTRFVKHLDDEALLTYKATGIGIGQQDFAVFNAAGNVSLFGLGSVVKIEFPLDIRHPRFEEKARRRGLDPEEIRRRAG